MPTGQIKMQTKIVVTLFAILLLAGCSSFHSHQVTKEGTITDVRATTFWDSKSELAKLKANTTEKSQSLGIGSLNTEASATNAVALAEAIARGIVSGLNPVKP